MRKIGITGQNGFVGGHLANTLKLYPDEFQVLDFDRSWFDTPDALDSFVRSCDVIVHLAALNRHNDPEMIRSVNLGLVESLVRSFHRTGSVPHVIMSSSTQEERGNVYGNSKKEGRKHLSEWATGSGAKFTGMVIPNVFGPFGEPFYNSVIATFCHQLTRGETPKIEIDGHLKLIYVGELVDEIIQVIRLETDAHELNITHTAEASVSEILNTLVRFKSSYQDLGAIPTIAGRFELNLFNTFRCYMDIEEYFPRMFTEHKDNRGAFVEIIRLGIGGQVSFSTTVPNVTRGNHFHTRKVERFAVIKGKAVIQMRRVGEGHIMEFQLDGDHPSYVDMPIWYTHNIKNVGDDVLYTIFWINEAYDPSDPDTFFEVV